jgi:hypothetical protein
MNRFSAVSWFLSLGLALAMGFQGGASQNHTTVKPDALMWKASDIFPNSAESAALVGDPHQSGDFTIRLKISGQYKVQPYSQSEIENITVLSGSVHVGFGSSFTTSGAEILMPGGFISIAPGTVHYWWTEEPSVLQLHGNGCLQLIYVGQTVAPAPCKSAAY